MAPIIAPIINGALAYFSFNTVSPLYNQSIAPAIGCPIKNNTITVIAKVAINGIIIIANKGCNIFGHFILLSPLTKYPTINATNIADKNPPPV